MTIPRHKTVAKKVAVTRSITHTFEFNRADLLRLLRLPFDAKLTLVLPGSEVDITDDTGALRAVCEETKAPK